MLFIIQQLAIIASKLIIRSSFMSAVHNSWLNPEISLLNQTVNGSPFCSGSSYFHTGVVWLQLV